ncbi:MAG: sensor histidine kinase [Sulfurimonadaceae bacterium]
MFLTSLANFKERLGSKLRSVTINQANIFTTLFIFLFTIIFAYLLIKENYFDYEQALHTEQRAYEELSLYDYEQQHERNRQKLKTLLIKNTIAIATLSFIIFAIMFGISKIFHTLLQRDIDAYLTFFKKAAHAKTTLDPDKLFFEEFKMMVTYANSMANTISEQKRVLQELNQGLEQQVYRKTKKLLESNDHLLKEQKLRDDLIKAQKEFLRYTVHETNTPLSVILTNIELYGMKHEKEKHISKIEVAVKNLFSIYDDLSYLVKKDQVPYPKTAIDLEAFLASRIDFFSEVAQMSRLCFSYMPKVKEAYIYFNETKLQRIIDNTITNAIKYTLPNETIEVTLDTDTVFLQLAIGSRSKEIHDGEKIFEAYYREAKGVEGFGLGLGLVKSLCQEEGVTIALDSSEKKNTFSYKFKMMGK